MTRLQQTLGIVGIVIVVASLTTSIAFRHHRSPALTDVNRPAVELEQEADRVLRDATRFYATVSTLQVTVHRTRTADDGSIHSNVSLVTFDRQREAFAVRPAPDSPYRTVVADGSHAYAFDPRQNAYATTDRGYKLYIGALLDADGPWAALCDAGDKVAITWDGEATYMGLEDVDGTSCNHVRVSSADGAEQDLWFENGPAPVLRRKSRGHVTIDFRDWAVNEELPADAFAMTPQGGATRIDLTDDDQGDVSAALMRIEIDGLHQESRRR